MVDRLIFDFECPYCGTSMESVITPERITLTPTIDVPLTNCPECYRDVTEILRTRLNAPLLLAVSALKVSGEYEGGRESLSRFSMNWQSVKDLLRIKGENPRNLSMLEDLFGFRNGRILSYSEVGRAYGYTGPGVYKMVQSTLKNLATNHKDVLQNYLNLGNPRPVYPLHLDAEPVTVGAASESEDKLLVEA